MVGIVRARLGSEVVGVWDGGGGCGLGMVGVGVWSRGGGSTAGISRYHLITLSPKLELLHLEFGEVTLD